MKSNIVLSYLFALKSYPIDGRFSLKGVDDPRTALIIWGRRRLFASTKRNRLLITKDILKKIVENKPLSVKNLNIDTAFKVTWRGFMRIGELTYTAAEVKKDTFTETDLTRSDISFSENDQYAILYMKQSKTNIKHTGVLIILTALGESTCAVAELRWLFIYDPPTANVLFFRLQSASFSHQGVINILKQRIAAAGLPKSNYLGHSFQKRVPQHAVDHGMLDESIQRLGRWTSNPFKLYFTITPKILFSLHLSI